ncbi:MAG: nucleotidyltransferase family protein [Sciscionella sp.]
MASPASSNVAGLLLAAGAGRRFGLPKALVELNGEPFLLHALRTLTDGGCAPVRVVLGARVDEARTLLPDPDLAVYAPDWAEGMGASLRTGLAALAALTPAPDAVLVQLVDLPDVDARIVARVAAQADGPDVVARATYHGRYGHPALFGRRWWSEIEASATGDRGARAWLSGRGDIRLVECADLGEGTDVDTPADLPHA